MVGAECGAWPLGVGATTGCASGAAIIGESLSHGPYLRNLDSRVVFQECLAKPSKCFIRVSHKSVGLCAASTPCPTLECSARMSHQSGCLCEFPTIVSFTVHILASHKINLTRPGCGPETEGPVSQECSIRVSDKRALQSPQAMFLKVIDIEVSSKSVSSECLANFCVCDSH